MKLKFFRAARFVAPMTLAAVVACGSDTVTAPPGSNPATDADRVVLQETLSDPNFQDALFGGSEDDGPQALILSLLSSNMHSVGSIDIATPQPARNAISGVKQNAIPVRRLAGVPQGSYKAFAGQIVLEVKMADSTERFVWTGLLAVNKLTNPTDIIIVGVAKEGMGNPPTLIPALGLGNEAENNDETNASYMYINPDGVVTVYEATTGSVTISNASFSGGKNCTFVGFDQLPGVSDFHDFEWMSCRVSNGAVKGKFNFTAAEVNGDREVTIPVTSFNLPASRTNLSVKRLTPEAVR